MEKKYEFKGTTADHVNWNRLIPDLLNIWLKVEVKKDCASGDVFVEAIDPDTDINRRKLEAAEEMAARLRWLHREYDPCHSVFYEGCRVCAALSAWEKARGKDENR